MALPSHATLKRKSTLPVWVSITWRVLAVVFMFVLAIGVHWFDRSGLRDNYDGHVSFADVVYFTMISITTVGYGDIVPVSQQARLFDALVVTPIRIFAVLLFIGTAYNFVLKRTWDKLRMAVIQKNLRGHIIVAGYGTTGSEAVDELIARGTDPGHIVVIDCAADALESARSCGCIILQGDATRDATLEDVKIRDASAMIVSAGRDDTSVLITLTARHLAPDLKISTVVNAEDNELPARAAGATTVINPVSFAGLLLANSCKSQHIADYMMDLASIDGPVALTERPVMPDEVGQPLSALATGVGLRLYRNGQAFGFFAPEARALQAGDLIVEVIRTRDRSA
ncbi:potassium channel family protein [Sphingomonas turrisvirgatae]|uniref:Potassium transporter TrkA n=1 Tax=Sphingomonas turrisvirgatae TaxID=1888892 RepID=A0A1E3LXT5_9SPHN|nr:potassium channel family protein [Sphingomonas turrisvirgatae]ODP38539.1 potassium transporter TrkA [Sphingomonas turrisvirgatae]